MTKVEIEVAIMQALDQIDDGIATLRNGVDEVFSVVRKALELTSERKAEAKGGATE